jgi:hypothetical protein
MRGASCWYGWRPCCAGWGLLGTCDPGRKFPHLHRLTPRPPGRIQPRRWVDPERPYGLV